MYISFNPGNEFIKDVNGVDGIVVELNWLTLRFWLDRIRDD